jgi:hypothetical protein
MLQHGRGAAHDGQAQPLAGDAVAVVQAAEFLEDALLLVVGMPGPVSATLIRTCPGAGQSVLTRTCPLAV